MTKAAREVLEDCRGAVDEIVDGIQGRAWRRRWFAAVALLRTVGYVLGKIDVTISPSYKRAIDHAWTKLKDSKRFTPTDPYRDSGLMSQAVQPTARAKVAASAQKFCPVIRFPR